VPPLKHLPDRQFHNPTDVTQTIGTRLDLFPFPWLP